VGITGPIAPQLARSASALPRGEEWVYEPKFDGFRAIVFVTPDDREIQSRGLKPLTRYFPELTFGSWDAVLDGEIIIAVEGSHSFEALQQRIHPAASRIERLAGEIPATFVAFDLLAQNGVLLMDRPFHERRAALEALVIAPVQLAPTTADPDAAARWLVEAEGVIAKDRNAPYLPGERKGMVKVKRMRTMDCVVIGWRPGKLEGTLGALILGAYGPDGELRVVGHSSGFSAKDKRELPTFLAPYETGERGSGDPSRWTGERNLEWIGLRPELVAEVTYDHASAGRIRHGTKLVRFRDDKSPADCTTDQLD
jgi:ATP-dependent DNA ligase